MLFSEGGEAVGSVGSASGLKALPNELPASEITPPQPHPSRSKELSMCEAGGREVGLGLLKGTPKNPRTHLNSAVLRGSGCSRPIVSVVGDQGRSGRWRAS